MSTKSKMCLCQFGLCGGEGGVQNFSQNLGWATPQEGWKDGNPGFATDVPVSDCPQYMRVCCNAWKTISLKIPKGHILNVCLPVYFAKMLASSLWKRQGDTRGGFMIPEREPQPQIDKKLKYTFMYGLQEGIPRSVTELLF